MEKSRIKFLLRLYIEHNITEAELLELEQVLTEDQHKENALEAFDQLVNEQRGYEDYVPAEWENIYAKVIGNAPGSESKLRNMGWIKWVAAATLLGFVIWSVMFYSNHRSGSNDQGGSVAVVQDVKAPESSRAMITLANGRIVYLDSIDNGLIATENGAEVSKNGDGLISYQISAENKQQSEISYNTLVNPRGSKVVGITLSDGTRVWLNAGSSLRYPVVFIGDKREVEMTGEGYFEVKSVNRESSTVKAHPQLPQREGALLGRKIPFFVRSGDVVTEVLGTQFNVHAYDDEDVIDITLLEGSVRVQKQTDRVRLVPRQQARVSNRKYGKVNSISILSGVDTEVVMAWKNGYFKFKGATTEEIMRQVSRWYNLEVVYEGDVKKERFAGSVPRSENVSQLLKVLELTKTVKFVIDDKKITVKNFK